MAALNFPSNPVDGQLYPDPAIPGQQQYVYNSAKGTWQTVSNAVGQVFGVTPIVVKGTKQAPIVTVNQASETESGYITPSDFAKIQEIPDTPGTVTEVIAGTGLNVSPALDEAPGSGEVITTKGTLNVTPATRTALGGITVGAGLNVTPEGRLDVTSATEDYAVLIDISPQFNGTQTTFNMDERGTLIPVAPTDVTRVWMFLGGVFQIPGISFIVPDGTNQLIFTEAPQPGTNFYGVVFL